jgi:DNA-binding CsgD family transcriptional regulator
MTGTSDRDLRAGVVAAIRDAVPADAYAFLLTDPDTTVGCSPLADVPDLATLPTLIRLKYLTAVNRWTALPTHGCASLWQATRGRPELSLVWRDYLSGAGVLDVASVGFADQYGSWGFLDLWRCDGRFEDEELSALIDVRPAITARLRRAQAAAFVAGDGRVESRGPGALVLTPALTIRTQTAQTTEWLAALVPPRTGKSPVPAAAYNVAAQLLATEAGVDDHPAAARVNLEPGVWLTLRADRLGGAEPLEQRDLVVTMEVSSPTERRDMFARSHGLTARETDVLRHLIGGCDTRAIAHMMSISELTVQDHLKSVFRKTRTSSRGELLAKCLGS